MAATTRQATDPSVRGLKGLVTYMRFVHDPIPVMHSLYREHGPFSAFRLINPLSGHEWLMVTAIGPEYNEQIFSNPNIFLATGMVPRGRRDSAHRRIRFGLISMNTEQHRQHRKLVTPPLHKKSVQGYRDVIVDLTAQTLDTWRDGEQRDIWRDMQELVLRISSTILFGGTDPEEAYRIGRMIDKWLTMCFYPSVYFFPLKLPGTPHRRLLDQAERLEAHIRAMVDRRRREGADGTDVLSILVRARQEDPTIMTDDELIGQVNVLFTASHETNMNTLTWTLFLLSQHPDIMADLFDELNGELRGEAPRIDQFHRLPLLERVIKESLRLLPPVVYKMRVVDQPVQVGPYHLPKGARVIYSHYMTHRLPELYPDPERFDPARWLSIDPSPYAYLPFGAGSRLCIGYDFSMTMLRITLAMILQRYRLSLLPGATIDRKFAVTMSPKYGMPMRVHNQDRQFTREFPHGNIHEMVNLGYSYRSLPRIRAYS